MPVSSTQVHGLGGSLKLQATSIAITEWSCDHANDIKDGTTSMNAGKKSWVRGIESGSGSFKCIWDTLANPYLINILPGTLCSVELHINGLTYFGFTAMVKNLSVSMPVQDLVTYTVNFESHGDIITPV
jgi:hypothetical protein